MTDLIMCRRTTGGIVCPYCGYQNRDLCDYNLDSTKEVQLFACGSCDRDCNLEIDTVHYFTTTKIGESHD